jgi:prepilin-type N-terminal cleavage/methylation domain-containing protein/prepilin-type processing-associated H-X9-DG protein
MARRSFEKLNWPHAWRSGFALRRGFIPRQGFTLVELLVVLAIIGILASMTFSVFSRVRDVGRRASCLSNLKQLGLGIQQYSQDHDEKLPNAAHGGDLGVAQDGVWMYYSEYPANNGNKDTFVPSRSSIFTYVKSKQVFVCPSDGNGYTSGNTYAYNSCLTSPAEGQSVWPGKSLAQFDNSADTLLLAEESDRGTTNDGLFNMFGPGPGWDYASYATRHVGGSCVAFLDGHAKYYTYSRLVSQNLATGNSPLWGAADWCSR